MNLKEFFYKDTKKFGTLYEYIEFSHLEIQRNITDILEAGMFELNSVQMRRQIVANITNLMHVKKIQNKITNFDVTCNENNNPPDTNGGSVRIDVMYQPYGADQSRARTITCTIGI